MAVATAMAILIEIVWMGVKSGVIDDVKEIVSGFLNRWQ